MTYAHFGARDRQNFHDRVDTLLRPNIAQIFVEKRLTSRWTAAADYVGGAGTKTLRSALSAEKYAWIDTIRFELYREMARPRGFGVGVHVSRSLSRHLTVQAGYGDVDTRQALLSGTEFFDGRRVYGQAAIRLSRTLSVNPLWTRAFANARPVAAGHRIEGGFLLDLRALRQ